MSDEIPAIGLNALSAITPCPANSADSRQQKQNKAPAGQNSPAASLQLSPEAEQQVQKLQARDREVRAHEQAHIAAGGPHVSGGASYNYQTGPDGRQYAIGGSVHIDTSPVPGDPKASAEKARTVRQAALAPANPSASDQNIAAKASAMESRARLEEREENTEQASLQPWPGPERAAKLYAAMRDSVLPQTALAPWGSGISIFV